MSATFDRWLQTVFDHPVGPGLPEWYWAPGFAALWDSLELDHAVTVDYLTRLFARPGVLRTYSLDQVAQAIWFLVGSSPAEPIRAVLDSFVPLNARVDCVAAIPTFFRDFVAPAAQGHRGQMTIRFTRRAICGGTFFRRGEVRLPANRRSTTRVCRP